MFLVDHIEQRRTATKKMDTMFYNSIKRAKFTYHKKIGLHVFKLLLLIAFLIIDTNVLHTDHWKLTNLMKLGIATCIINAIINFAILNVGYRDNQNNNKHFLHVAEATNHSCPQEQILAPDDFEHLQNCVSQRIYNIGSQSMNGDQALTPQIRDRYENIYSNLIQGEVLQKHKSLPCFDLLGRMLSLATVIFGIVALATSSPSVPEIIVLSIYLLLESLNIWMIVLIILFLAFSPLLCCCGCLYLMCFGTSAFIDRSSLNIPEPTTANATIIEQTDGSCTICLQNFSLNQKLIVLSCSPKHAFHQNCILNWLRVSNSCPICRSPIPQAL